MRVATVLAVGLAGCFNPKIEDGFACDRGDEEPCPEGFDCCDDGTCRADCEGGGEGEGEAEAEAEAEAKRRATASPASPAWGASAASPSARPTGAPAPPG